MLRSFAPLLVSALLALAACAPASRPVVSLSGAGGVQAGTAVASRLDGSVAAAAGMAGRHARGQMVLTREGPAPGQEIYYFAGIGASRITLSFMVQTRSRLRLRALCDGPARAMPNRHLVSEPPWMPAGQAVRLELGPGERRRTLLELDPSVRDCALTVTPGGYPPYTLTLRREDAALPRIAALDAPLPSCPAGAAGDPLMRAFLATAGMAASCPARAGSVRFLGDGVAALDARVRALTGRSAGRTALETGDPDMPLDWSNAPQLDLIYVNYLNLNADFAGYLMARMLAFHAARGTIVRILVSDVMFTQTDRRLFEGLAARYPTVQLQSFRFPAEAARGFEGQFGRLHRVSHVKLFATVARQPHRSVALIGGRNIHEGYFFDTPRDLSDWPFLHQYDPEAVRLSGGFTAYDDFEIALDGAQAVDIARHMGAMWHRDHDSQALMAPAGTAPARGGEGAFRHFISAPVSDGAAQERYFVGLIDAAQERIRIASPYLNLTPALEAALRRARARGVSVQVVATVRVREATDFMVTGLNRQFANDFGDWIAFYDYDPAPRLLHSKIFVFDGRLALVTSTNLNQRSFVHDFENGVAIMDRGTARRLEAVIGSYVDRGTRVAPGQPVPRLVRALARVPLIARLF